MSSRVIGAARELIQIGIPSFDERLKPGIPNNSLILLIGDPGSGFDIFLHQLLYLRNLHYRSRTLYVSLDRPVTEIQWEMAAYRWNSDAWDFIDLSPTSKKISGYGGTIAWESNAANFLSHNLMRRLTQIKEDEENKGSKSPIDSAVNSLTSLLLNSDLQTVLGFVNEYASNIRDTRGIHVMTLVRGVHGTQVEQVLSHYADVVFEFVMAREGASQEYTRYMGLRKVRGVSIPPTRMFKVKITQTGLMPETIEQI